MPITPIKRVIIMPTKHIDDVAWRLVEQQVVKAVTESQTGIKDTKLMNYALIKGLKSLTKEDYMELAKK